MGIMFCLKKRAITMIELMAVLVIISVFTAIVAPDVVSYLKESKKKASIDNVKIIREAINSYIIDHSHLPQKSSVSASSMSGSERQDFFSKTGNTDTYLAYPSCLQQLVKEKYLLYIPENPFTGDDSWEVRGFAEPKNLDTSWIAATVKNNDSSSPEYGKYDGAQEPTGGDYTILMPKVSSNSLREIDETSGLTAEVTLGAIVGIFDVRCGDAENNNHADIDTWDEREDGRWKYIPDVLETLTVNPNRIELLPGESVNFLNVLDLVVTYTQSPPKSSLGGDFPPEPNVTFSVPPDSGVLVGSDQFTATMNKGIYSVGVECEEDGFVVNSNFSVDISPDVEEIFLETDEITILIGSKFNLKDIEVTAKYYGIPTPEVVTYSDDLEWKIIGGTVTSGGTIINRAFYQDGGTVEVATLQARYTKRGITKSKNLKINIISIVERIYIEPIYKNISLKTGETFDLKVIDVYAEYTDGLTELITPDEWNIYQYNISKGTIETGLIYRAVDSEEITVKLEAVYYYKGNPLKDFLTVDVRSKLISVKCIPDVFEFKNAHAADGFLSPGLPVDISTKVMVLARFSDNSEQMIFTGINFFKESGESTASITPDGVFDVTDKTTTASTTVRVRVFYDGEIANTYITLKLRPVVVDLDLYPKLLKLKNDESINIEDINGTVTYSNGSVENIIMPSPYLSFQKATYSEGYFKESTQEVYNPITGTVETKLVKSNTFYADSSNIGSINIPATYTFDNEEVYDSIEIKVYQRLKELEANPEKMTILTGETVDVLNDIDYFARYSNSSFDHMALSNLSFVLKDDNVNPVIGTLSVNIFTAPSNISGTQEVIATYYEDYGGEVPADTASVNIFIGIKAYLDSLKLMPSTTEIYTYGPETAEVWFDQFGNRYTADTDPAVIWVDEYNVQTHELYAVGTAEVYKDTYGILYFDNSINFDEYCYLEAHLTDDGYRTWGKGVSVGWLDNPEDIKYTIESGPGDITGRTFIPPSDAGGVTVIRCDYTYDGTTVSTYFTATVNKKPLNIDVLTPKGSREIELYAEMSFNLGSLEIYVGYSDNTTTEFRIEDPEIIWRPTIGYRGTFEGTTYDAPPDLGRDTVEIIYADTPFEFWNKTTGFVYPFDQGYQYWKDYSAEVKWNTSRTYLPFVVPIYIMAEPTNIIAFEPPEPVAPDTWETHPHATVRRLITDTEYHLWDRNNLLTVLFFSEASPGESAEVIVNEKPDVYWQIVSGGGSIIDSSGYSKKTYVSPSLPQNGIQLRPMYIDNILQGELTGEIVTINVVKPTSLTLKPSNITINTGDSINMNTIITEVLYSDGATEEASVSAITWSKDSGDGDLSGNLFTTDDMTNSGSAILNCNYNYGGSIFNEKFNITINVIPPNAPDYITTVDRAFTELEISWPDSKNTSSYNVYINNVLDATYPFGTNSHVFENLISGTTYEISIGSVNAGGESVPRVTKDIRTVGIDPPDWVQLTGGPMWDRFRIEWKRVGGTTTRKRVDGYHIFLNGTLFMDVPYDSANEIERWITGVDPSTTYTVQVRAYKGANLGDFATLSPNPTTDNLPSVSNLQNINNIYAEKINAKWDIVNGVSGYIARIVGPSTDSTEIIVGSANVNHTFYNLKPDTEYKVFIQSYYDGTIPPLQTFMSAAKTFTTRTEYFGDQPGEFVLNETIKYETINVSWNALSETSTYELWIGPEGSPVYFDEIIAPSINYTYTGLTPKTTYEVLVKAISANDNQIGHVSNIYTTDYADLNIIVSSVTAGELSFDWTAVPEADHYKLHFGTPGAVFLRDTTEITYSVSGLLPDETYEIFVQAESLTPMIIGESILKQKTNPLLPPENINVTNITYTDFDVSWTDPNGLSGQEYKIYVNGIEVGSVDETTFNFSYDKSLWPGPGNAPGPGETIDLEIGIFYLGAVRGSGSTNFTTQDLNPLTVYFPTDQNTDVSYKTFNIAWNDPNTAPAVVGDYSYRVFINTTYKSEEFIPTNSWSEDGTHGLGPGDDVTVEVSIYYMGSVRKTTEFVFQMKNFDPLTVQYPVDWNTDVSYKTFNIEWSDPNSLPVPIDDYSYRIFINGTFKTEEFDPVNSWSEDGTHGLGPGDDVTVEVGIYYMGIVRQTTEFVFQMKNFDPLTVQYPVDWNTDVSYKTFNIEWSDPNSLPVPIDDYSYRIFINGTFKIEEFDPVNSWSEDGTHGLGPGDDVTVEVGIYYMGIVRQTTEFVFQMKNFDPLTVYFPTDYDTDVNYTTFNIEWNDTNALPVPLDDYSYRIFVNNTFKTEEFDPVNSWSEDGSHGLGPGQDVTVEVSIYYMSALRQTTQLIFNMEPLPAPVINPSPIPVSDIGQSTFEVSWNSVTDADGYKIYIDGTEIADVDAATNTYIVTGLTPGGTYNLEIAGTYDIFVGLKASETVSLKPADVDPTTITMTVTDNSGPNRKWEFSWGDATGATSYEWELYIYEQNGSITKEDSGSGSYPWSYDLKDDFIKYPHMFKIRSINSIGTSNWVNAFVFGQDNNIVSVINPSSEILSNVSGIGHDFRNGGTSDDEFEVWWNSVPSATTYSVYCFDYDGDWGFGYWINKTLSVTSHTFYIGNFERDDDWIVFIKAYASGKESDWQSYGPVTN